MRRWIPTLWLGFVIVRYGSTAMKALRAPFNDGADLPWAWAWLAFLTVLAISTALLTPRSVHRLWGALTFLAILVFLTLSHTWVPASIALTMLLVCAGVGEFVLQRFKTEPTPILDRIVVAIPIGLGVLALAQLSLALLGAFNKTTSWLLLMAMAIPAVAAFRKSAIRNPQSAIPPSFPMATIPIFWIFILNLLWTIAPELQFDALSVHLAVPRIYLEHGGVIDLPYFTHSYFVHLFDMLFGFCLAVGGPQSAKFLILSTGLIATAGVYAIGRMLFSGEVGAWAALIFYSTPLVIWLSGTTYIDLAETCFIVAAIVAFLRWAESGSPGWLIATGWISGVAVGTKVNAITVLAPLVIGIALYAKRKVRAVLIYTLLLLIVAAPWYAAIYEFTGNPFFPFMNATFQSPQWESENTQLDAAMFGIGKTPSSLLRLPFRLTWDTTRFGYGLPRGGVGFALLLVLPMIVFVRRSATMGILIACVALHLITWALSFQYGRYYIPVLPLIAVLGCSVFLDANARWNRVLLLLGIAIQVPIASLMFWNIPERFPLEYAMGRETEARLLSRGLMGYDGVQFINRVIRPGEKVLSIGMENLRFHLNASLYSLAEASRGHELRGLAEAKPDAELAKTLIRMGIRYVITPLTDLQKPEEFYPWLNREFVQRFETNVYSDNTVAVLWICGVECDASR